MPHSTWQPLSASLHNLSISLCQVCSKTAKHAAQNVELFVSKAVYPWMMYAVTTVLWLIVYLAASVVLAFDTFIYLSLFFVDHPKITYNCLKLIRCLVQLLAKCFGKL